VFGTLITRLGERAHMPFPIFPHMLRHACGYALANAGRRARQSCAPIRPLNSRQQGATTDQRPAGVR